MIKSFHISWSQVSKHQLWENIVEFSFRKSSHRLHKQLIYLKHKHTGGHGYVNIKKY